MEIASHLKAGHYRSLFKFLEIRKNEQLFEAQQSAFAGNSEMVVYGVMATRLYDELLSWQDQHEGALAQQVLEIRRQLEAERNIQGEKDG